MPAGVLDENVDLRYTIKLDAIAATVRLKRFNYELAKTQALLGSISGAGLGSTAMIAGVGRGSSSRNIARGGISRGLAAQSAAIGALSSKVSDLGNVALKAGVAMSALAGYAGFQYAKWEKTGFSFAQLVGDRKVSDKLIADIKKYSGPLPLTTMGVVEGARRMLAHGIAPENIMDMTKMVGNIAIGLGKQIPEIITPIARAKMMGVLQGQEYNMLIDAGINLGEADYYAQVKKGNIKDTPENKKQYMGEFKQYVMDQNYTWDKMLPALRWLGNEKFGSAAAEAQDLLSSKVSGLADEMELLAAAFGEMLVEGQGIKEMIQGWTDALAKFKENLSPEDVKFYSDMAIEIAKVVGAMYLFKKAIDALKWSLEGGKALKTVGSGVGRAAGKVGTGIGGVARTVGAGAATAGTVGGVAAGLTVAGLLAAVGAFFWSKDLQDEMDKGKTQEEIDERDVNAMLGNKGGMHFTFNVINDGEGIDIKRGTGE